MPGGQIATAMATACARLGWRTRYIGSFGDDELGALSRESLMREGVDVSAARTVAGATNQFAVVLVDARTGRAHGALGSASRSDDGARTTCRGRR